MGRTLLSAALEVGLEFESLAAAVQLQSR